jgi:glycosyltransferase involved in cell wall biosynthesis
MMHKNTEQLISIAICVFNGEKFLEKQLDSIFSQTRLPDEIVVVNDNSYDGTFEILKMFEDKFGEKMKIFHNEIAIGYGENFKKAILKCSGDYIFLCDQDDIWYPKKIEIFMRAWEMYPNATGLFCNADIFPDEKYNESLSLWDVTYGTTNLFTETNPEQYWPMLVINHSFILGATMAVKRAAAQNAFSFSWLPGFCFHDYHLALHLSFKQQLFPIPEKLQEWRQHESQQTGAAGYLAKREKVQLARRAWLGQWQPIIEGIDICRYWAFGLTQLEQQYDYWKEISPKQFEVMRQKVVEKFVESKQRYFATLPWTVRKKKLLKHWLKGGEYLRITSGDLLFL